MKKKYKVLHILNHSYPMSDGYAIRSYNIIKNQKRIGIQPIVLTSLKHELCYNSNPELIEGVYYYRSNSKNKSFIMNFFSVFSLFYYVLKIYNVEKFCVIHSHSPSLNGLSAYLSSRVLKIPFVYEIRAFWEDAAVDSGKMKNNSFKYKMYRKLETFVVKNANAVVTIADYLFNDINKRIDKKKNNKVYKISNGVDCSRFYPIQTNVTLKQKYSNNNSLVLGFIGSFYNFEGLDTLLKALKILQEKGYGFTCILVGDGEKFESWKNLSKSIDIKNIYFTGRIPYNKVIDYYSIMDIMVYPRKSERITETVTPLKPLEAMATKKLIVASNVGGIRELIKNDQGILFKPDDHVELANKLADILDNQEKYLNISNNGYLNVKRNFSWLNIINKYHFIYSQILDKNNN